MRVWMLLPLLLAGCGGGELEAKDKNTDDTDGPTDVEDGCSVKAEAIDPEYDATNLDADVEFTVDFDGKVKDSDVKLTFTPDIDGTTKLSSDGESVTFTPDGEFEKGVEYEVLVEVCDDTNTTVFTIVADPLPANSLLDNTYGIAEADMVWIKPAGATLVTGQLNIEYFLLQISAVGANTLDTLMSMGNTDTSGNITPDCLTKSPGGTVSFAENPYFEGAAVDLPINIDGTNTVTVENFTISGYFNADGSELQDVLMTGAINTTGIDSLVPVVTACQALGALGIPCEPCKDSSVKCLSMEATAKRALELGGTTISGTCP